MITIGQVHSYLWLLVLGGAVPLDSDILAGGVHGDCEGLLEVLHVVWHRDGELHGGHQAASRHSPVTLTSDHINVSTHIMFAMYRPWCRRHGRQRPPGAALGWPGWSWCPELTALHL